MAVLNEQVSLLEYKHLKKVASKKVLIVATEWNEKIIAEQIAGATRIADELKMELNIQYVPGAIEIPFAIKKLIEKDNYDAVIAFGAVIRGGTPHFDYVCKYVTEGVLALNMNLDIPIIFGVLTLESEEQAWERLGGELGHKGEEAMIAAAKMSLL